MKNITQQAALNAQGSQRKDIEVLTAGLAPEALLAEQPAGGLLADITEPTIGDEFDLQPEQQFPPTFAVVYVEAKGDRYFVRAYNAAQCPLYTAPSAHPSLAIAVQMEQKKRKASEIRGIVREFSKNNSEAKKIRGWLTKLRTTLQEQLGQNLDYVVIHDRTDFEIPWEMLNLSNNEHLGSSVVTVRWQDVQVLEDGWDEERLTPLNTQAEDCLGAIIAYINTKDFQGVKDEISLLQRYNAQCVEDVHQFLHHLHQVRSPVSLVFVASHGFLGEAGVFDAALGEKDKKKQISFSELCGWDFDFLKTYRSIVFMNACHSGRLRWEKQFVGRRMGLATFFLERGARGVIGTAGQIEDLYAPKIAQCFFAEYENAPNQSVAEVLRRIREQALQNFEADPSDENWKLFLFTFMYLYYGNPMTVLCLSPPKG